MIKMDIFQRISIISVFCLILSTLPFLSQARRPSSQQDTAQEKYRWQESDPNLLVLQQAFMASSGYETQAGGATFTFSQNTAASQALRNVCKEEYNNIANNLNRGFSGGRQGQELIRGIVSQYLGTCIMRYNLSSSANTLSLNRDQRTHIEKATAVFKKYFYNNVNYPANVLNLNSWLEDYEMFKINCSRLIGSTPPGESQINLLSSNIQILVALHQNHCPTLLSNLKKSLETANGTLQEFFALAGGEACEARQRQCVGELRKMAGLDKRQRQTASLNELPESEKSLFEFCQEGFRETQDCCTGSDACPLMDKGQIYARYQSSLNNGAQRHGAKLCQAQNLTEMTNDYMALTEDLCVDSSNKCTETCNEKLNQFKQAFLDCFFAPDFIKEARVHLEEKCKTQMTEILTSYKQGTLNRQMLSFESKSEEDIKDCGAPLTALKQRQNSASYQASAGQEMAGVCQEYAQANPSLFKTASVKSSVPSPVQTPTANNRGLASAANSSRMTKDGESLSSQPVETEPKPANKSVKAISPLGWKVMSDNSIVFEKPSPKDEAKEWGIPDPVVNKTPQEWRDHLIYLRETEGLDPIAERARAQKAGHNEDCNGSCDADLYGRDGRIREEAMKAAKIPVFDPENPLWRGDYFDNPANVVNKGHIFQQRDRLRRRSNLRKWREREKREEELLKQLQRGQESPQVVDGPATKEGILASAQGHARMTLRKHEILTITCLDFLRKGNGRCHSEEWSIDEEIEFFERKLRDIREHKDPYYSWRGTGVPMPDDEILFRPGHNLVKKEPPAWNIYKSLEK